MGVCSMQGDACVLYNSNKTKTICCSRGGSVGGVFLKVLMIIPLQTFEREVLQSLTPIDPNYRQQSCLESLGTRGRLRRASGRRGLDLDSDCDDWGS